MTARFRPATARDIPRIVCMARDFHEQHKPAWPFDGVAMGRTLEALPYLTVSQGGFFAGAFTFLPMSPGWGVASEFLMWAQDGTGVAQARAFRKWARAKGAREIRWSCPPNARVQSFYSRIGSLDELIYSEVP